MIIDLNSLSKYDYVSIKYSRWEQNRISENKYEGNLRNTLYLSSFNDNIKTFMDINDDSYKNIPRTKSVFIGAELDSVGIENCIISKGISKDKILIINKIEDLLLIDESEKIALYKLGEEIHDMNTILIEKMDIEKNYEAFISKYDHFIIKVSEKMDFKLVSLFFKYFYMDGDKTREMCDIVLLCYDFQDIPLVAFNNFPAILKSRFQHNIFLDNKFVKIDQDDDILNSIIANSELRVSKKTNGIVSLILNKDNESIHTAII